MVWLRHYDLLFECWVDYSRLQKVYELIYSYRSEKQCNYLPRVVTKIELHLLSVASCHIADRKTNSSRVDWRLTFITPGYLILGFNTNDDIRAVGCLDVGYLDTDNAPDQKWVEISA